MKNHIKKSLKASNGITLIALVITIIVLLILAGISISMLSGDNGILTKVAESKDTSERAQFCEAALMAYNSILANKYSMGGTPTLEEIVTELRKEKYIIEEDTISGTSVTGVMVDNNLIGVEKNGIETVNYTIQTKTEDDKIVYLAILNGNKYQISIIEGKIIVSDDIYIPEDDTTITVTTSNTEKAIATVDENENQITINGLEDGNEIVLKVTVGGKTFDVGEITIKTLTSVAQPIYAGGTNFSSSTLTLDGAMLLSAGAAGSGTTSSPVPSTIENAKYLWKSSNPEVVRVTQEGIIMCSNKTSYEADEEKAGSGTVTIKLIGSDGVAKAKTITVRSISKIASSTDKNINRTINGTNGEYNNPTIPKGFVPIDTNMTGNTTQNIDWKLSGTQTNTNKGLVIMDDNGNQFVWVPVPDVIASSRTAISTEEINLATNPLTIRPMAVYQNGSTTNYEGVLYTFSGTNSIYQSGYKLGTEISREPDVLRNGEDKKTSADAGDFTFYSDRGYNLLTKHIVEYRGKNVNTQSGIIKSGWTNQITNEYRTMINKINDIKGFWVGRYETSYDLKYAKVASIAGARTRTSNGDESTGMRTWYGLYQKQKDFAGGEDYITSMIWGSQWDAMMNWMAKNGESIGTRDNSNNPKRNRNGKYITGDPNYTTDKVCNIFDLCGCTFEWTLEAKDLKGRTKRRRWI